MIKFEWDTTKANSNKKKHGVSFEEAQSVFYNEFAVQFFDGEAPNRKIDFWCLVLAMKRACWLCAIANEIKETSSELSQPEKPPKLKVNITKELNHENWIWFINHEIS